MRRFSILLSVVAVVLSTAIVLWQPTALAQEATPAAMGNHPVVGAWQLENDTGGGDTFTSYAVFLPDGTYIEASHDGATLVGVWRATGERTADLTLFAADVDPAPNAITLGEGRFTVEVDAEGSSRTGVVVEYSPTEKLFTNPEDQRTEDYVTGKFG